MFLLVECVRFVWFVQGECIISKGEVGGGGFPLVVGPCRPYIPCNSQDDFHHRGHIGHHSRFLFLGLSSGHLRISLITVWDGNNFWCAHIFLTVCTLSNQYLFCVGAVRILFCAVVYILLLGYRSGGSRSIPGTTKEKNSGSGTGSTSFVSTTEELLDRTVATPV
jgi:hypothetical protein